MFKERVQIRLVGCPRLCDLRIKTIPSLSKSFKRRQSLIIGQGSVYPFQVTRDCLVVFPRDVSRIVTGHVNEADLNPCVRIFDGD